MEYKILVFGDSITRGAWDTRYWWRVNRLKLYFDKIWLSHKIKFVTVYNLWVAGDDTIQLLDRFGNEIIWKSTKDSKIIVIFAIGMNDTMFDIKNQKVFTDQKIFLDNINLLFQKAKKHTNNILCIGFNPVDESRLDPVPWFDAQISYKNVFIKEYNNLILDQCKKCDISFVEIFDEFVKYWNYNELLDDDWLHPNSKWHNLVFGIIKRKINKLFF